MYEKMLLDAEIRSLEYLVEAVEKNTACYPIISKDLLKSAERRLKEVEDNVFWDWNTDIENLCLRIDNCKVKLYAPKKKRIKKEKKEPRGVKPLFTYKGPEAFYGRDAWKMMT